MSPQNHYHTFTSFAVKLYLLRHYAPNIEICRHCKRYSYLPLFLGGRRHPHVCLVISSMALTLRSCSRFRPAGLVMETAPRSRTRQQHPTTVVSRPTRPASLAVISYLYSSFPNASVLQQRSRQEEQRRGRRGVRRNHALLSQAQNFVQLIESKQKT